MIAALSRRFAIVLLLGFAACGPLRTVSVPDQSRLPIAADEVATTVELPQLGLRVTLGDVAPMVRQGEGGIEGGNPDGHMSAEVVGVTTAIFFTCWDGRVQLSCRAEHQSIDDFIDLSALNPVRRGRFRSVLDGPIANDSHESGYAALQSTWRDPRTGTIHGWYHAEIFVRDDHECGAYASIGYATSADHGRFFKKEGIVLTSPYPKDDSRCLGQGVQGPRVIERGDHLYMFFTIDHPQVLSFRGIGIARASKDDPGTWHKYHNGAFEARGLGGEASAIIPRGDGHGQIWHASVSWNAHLGQYLMLHTDYDREGAVMLRTSNDMIVWSNPAVVMPASNEYGYRYPTLFGDNEDVTNRTGWLYFGRTRLGARLGPDTFLARRRLVIDRLAD